MINADGHISLCCMDWDCRMSIGDCNVDTLQEIWNSEKLYQFQLLHLNMKKDNILLCKKCKAIDVFTVDDIDEYATDIIKRM